MSYQAQIEMDLPFKVDLQGRIAFTQDPSRVLRNHVLSIIGTELGERVMRPGYGTSLQSLLFDSDYDATAQVIADNIERAIIEYEPGVTVHSVTLDPAGNELDGLISLNVSYSAVNSPFETVQIPINTASLYRGGAIEEERRA